MKREHYLLLRSLVKCGTGELWCLLVREIGSNQTFLPLLVVGGFGSSLNMSLCLDFLVVFSANFVAICFLLVCSISRFNSRQPLAYSLPVIVATAFLCTLEIARDCFFGYCSRPNRARCFQMSSPLAFPECCESLVS